MSHLYSRDKLGGEPQTESRCSRRRAAAASICRLPNRGSALPLRIAKPAQQTAPKTTVSRPAVQSSAGWKGVTPRRRQACGTQTALKATQTAAVKQLPTFSVGQSLHSAHSRTSGTITPRRVRGAGTRVAAAGTGERDGRSQRSGGTRGELASNGIRRAMRPFDSVLRRKQRHPRPHGAASRL